MKKFNALSIILIAGIAFISCGETKKETSEEVIVKQLK